MFKVIVIHHYVLNSDHDQSCIQQYSIANGFA